MTFWYEHALVETHLSELHRQAGDRHAAAARGTRGDREASPPRLQQRLGLLLVEAGLYLLTRTDRGRATRSAISL
jgi:hypothetical protein